MTWCIVEVKSIINAPPYVNIVIVTQSTATLQIYSGFI